MPAGERYRALSWHPKTDLQLHLYTSIRRLRTVAVRIEPDETFAWFGAVLVPCSDVSDFDHAVSRVVVSELMLELNHQGSFKTKAKLSYGRNS